MAKYCPNFERQKPPASGVRLSVAISPSGEKRVHFRFLGGREEVPPQAAALRNRACAHAQGESYAALMLSALRLVDRVLGASQTSLRFLVGCGERLRGLSLLPWQASSWGLKSAASPLRHFSVTVCHPALALKLLSVLQCCYPAYIEHSPHYTSVAFTQ